SCTTRRSTSSRDTELRQSPSSSASSRSATIVRRGSSSRWRPKASWDRKREPSRVRSSCARPTRSSLRALLAVLALALAAADAPDDVGKTLDAVQKRYDAVKDMRAAFTQTSFAAALGKESEARGTVAVERPGKMRWEYAPPDGRVIVLDEQAIRIW